MTTHTNIKAQIVAINASTAAIRRLNAEIKKDLALGW